MDIEFLENDDDLLHQVRCGEIFYENKDQKLSYHCLFCNLIFYQNQLKEFSQHILDHLDFESKIPEPENETPKTIDLLNIDFVQTNNDSELIQNATTEREETKTIITNIKSFSEYNKNKINIDKQIQKFQCPYCAANYRRRSPLYVHLEKNHGIVTSFEIQPDVFGKFPCPKCDVECCNKGSFILHVRRKHEDYFYSTLEKQQMEQDLRDQKFSQHDFEILINEDMSKEPAFKSTKNNSTYKISSSNFLNIEKIDNSNIEDFFYLDKSKNKKHDCPCCVYTCTTRYGIYKHLEKQHGIAAILKVKPNSNGKYECSECGLLFDFKGNIVYHVRQKHKEHYFSLLEKQEKLSRSQQNSNAASNNPDNADFVDLTFGEIGVKTFMNKRIKIHHCSHCNFWTERANNLYRHLEAKHNIAALLEVESMNSNGKYECPHCSLITDIIGVFIYHLKRKHNAFFCELLDQQQKKKNDTDPIISYASEKKLTKRDFISISNENKNFDTTETTIEYLRNEYYEDTMDNRCTKKTGINKFKCPYCEEKYSLQSSFNNHLEEDHGITTILEVEPNSSGKLECPQCDITLSNRDSFINHLKLKHKIQVDVMLIAKQNNILTNESIKSKISKNQNVGETGAETIQPDANIFHNCSKCEYRSEFRSLICRHLESKHGVEALLRVKPNTKGKYICSKCKLIISNKEDFIYHLKRKHENYYYNLIVEQQIEDEQKSHKKNHICSDISEDESLSETELNNKILPHNDNVLELLSSLKPVQKINNYYSCPQENCEFSTTTFKKLQNHNREVHSDLANKSMRYQCPNCDLSYSNQAGIAKHLELIHGIANRVIVEPQDDGKFHCTKCDLILKRKLSYIVHLKKKHEEYYHELLVQQQSIYESHQTKSLIICEICNKEVPSYAYLKRHMEYHNQPKIECKVCAKHLSSKSSLTSHMKTHSGIRNYSCNFCHLKFTKKEVKDKHELRIHLKQRNYQCDECGQQFYTGNSLKNHLRRHNNERPEKCDICHKTFFDSNSLRMHKQTHSDVKKYECEMCQKKFSRSHHLKNHRAIHNSLKKFKCIICNMDFAQNAGLYSHMKNRHKDLNKNCLNTK